MTIKSSLFLLLFFISSSIFSQVINLEWAYSSGGNSYDNGRAIVSDASGSIYIIGTFQSTVDFDPSPAFFNLTSNGINDVFIKKMDINGVLIWAVSIGNTQDDYGHSIALDAAGNVYVTGTFEGTVDLDPGAGTANYTSNGLEDIFTLKLDANGNFVWANSFGGTMSDVSNSIALDGMDNVYTTGKFEGTIDLDPSAGTSNFTSNGASDIFVQKLDAAGSFIWANSIGGALGDNSHSIDTDAAGNVFITGLYQGMVDFDPGVATFNVASAGDFDAFVQKMDPTGGFLWVTTIGDVTSDGGQAITIDISDNVYSTGVFQGTVDFDPSGTNFDITSNGDYDSYIQKLDNNGVFVWATSIGGVTPDGGHAITTDAAGNVYSAGVFQGTVDFDPSGAIFNLTSNGDYDVYVQKLDGNSNLDWSISFGSAVSDFCKAITIDPSDNIYIAGPFENTIDFDPSATVSNVTSVGSADAYIVKYNQIANWGINENNLFSNVSIYPNPTEGTVNINLSGLTDVSIKIMSINGQLIYNEQNINTPIHQIELFESPGIYFIELMLEGEKEQFKLVIR